MKDALAKALAAGEETSTDRIMAASFFRPQPMQLGTVAPVILTTAVFQDKLYIGGRFSGVHQPDGSGGDQLVSSKRRSEPSNVVSCIKSSRENPHFMSGLIVSLSNSSMLR